MSAYPASTRTSLRHRATSSVSLPLAVIAGLHPKRNRNRTLLLTLLAIVSLSVFFVCSRYPIPMSPAYLRWPVDSEPSDDQLVLPVQPHPPETAPKKHHQKLAGGRPSITLTPEQELAAVSSFLASLPQNVIPLSVDPSLPIDPELVLDFDTRSPRAAEEVERVVEDVWSRNPVLLYGKLYSPPTREIKSILASLNLRPPPFTMDVDMRDDKEVLEPILFRLTAMPELPILLINGQPVGSLERIREMHASGELHALIKAAGAVIGGGRRRKHGK
ncbi:glutaredoxin domain-containing protein [Favolaschia claudopus]|uniref:Glutaredoxin domain-containing protein n=1 Tax=Favolaschia claudopus TaxID=2862362 RepID=A0AAW0B1U4_9AGAR